LAILVALLVTFSPPFMPRNQARRGKVYWDNEACFDRFIAGKVVE
jgi:hypothetical protein